MSNPNGLKPSQIKNFISLYTSTLEYKYKNIVYCQCCDKNLTIHGKSHVYAHIESKKHQKTSQNNFNNKEKEQTNKNVVTKGELALILSEGMVKSDVPLHKLRHKAFKNIFVKLLGLSVSETCVRNKVESLYELGFLKLFKLIQNEQFYIILDESMKKGLKHWNFLIGLVKNPGKEYILATYNTYENSSNVIVELFLDKVLKNTHLNMKTWF